MRVRQGLTESLTKAQANLDNADIVQDIEKVAADKGYHKAELLADCETLGRYGIKTYIPEREGRYQHTWEDKPCEQERAYRLNRQRTKRDHGKRMQKKRSEVVERTFAHTCETGGARRSWLQGIGNVGKRYLMQAAAHNLGRVMRKLLGSGKPREFAGRCAAFIALRSGLQAVWSALGRSLNCNEHRKPLSATFSTLAGEAGRAWGRRRRITLFSTGC